MDSDRGPEANLASLLTRHIDRMSISNASGRMGLGDLAKQMMLLDALANPILGDHKRFQDEIQEAWSKQLPERMPERAQETARWYAALGVTLKWLYEENVLRRAPADWEDLSDY